MVDDMLFIFSGFLGRFVRTTCETGGVVLELRRGGISFLSRPRGDYVRVAAVFRDRVRDETNLGGGSGDGQ
jgi:hypothetical protein